MSPDPATGAGTGHARRARPPAPRAGVRAAKQAATREALLESAERLIAEQSLASLSLREVCSRAGFSQGAFYSNFDSREDLLLAVMERNLERHARSLERMLQGAVDCGLEDTLRRVARWMKSVHQRRTWAHLAIELRLGASRDPVFARRMGEVQARTDHWFGQRIAALVERHDLRASLPPDQVASTILMLSRALALRDPVAGETALPEGQVIMLCLRALLGVPAPD